MALRFETRPSAGAQDAGTVEMHLQDVECRLGSRDLCLGGPAGGDAVVLGLAADGGGLEQLLAALLVRPGGLEGGLRLADRGLLLSDLGDKKQVVQPGEDIALPDGRALVDQNLGHRDPVGLGADNEFLPSGDTAGRGDGPCEHARCTGSTETESDAVACGFASAILAASEPEHADIATAEPRDVAVHNVVLKTSLIRSDPCCRCRFRSRN